MRTFLAGAFAATRRCSLGVALLVALGLAGCGGGESSAEPDVESAADTSAAPSGEADGLTYIALGDSWIQGAHCNGCRTFPQTDAEALSELLGKPVTFQNLAGDNQPYLRRQAEAAALACARPSRRTKISVRESPPPTSL